MNHIRFMSNNTPICEKPMMLGSDVVVIDTDGGETPSCKVCSDLLFTHNLREYDRESRMHVGVINPKLRLDQNPDPKGFMLGFILASVFWLTVIFMTMWIVR